jgi:hypothetical protein
MTTTYETSPTDNTIAGLWVTDPTEAVPVYDTDSSTHTIAEAWSSSPLDAFGEDGYDAPQDETPDERRRDSERAKLFAVLAAGIIGGATVGAVLFGSIEPAMPTFIVPDSGVSTSPMPSSSSATPSSAASAAPTAPKPAAIAPVQKPAGQAPAPKPDAPKPEPAPPAPAAEADPGTPPPVVSAPPVVINIPIPPLPPAQPVPDPQPPAPEDPPAPKPPVVFNPGNIDVAQVPQADDDPSRTQLYNPDEQKPGRFTTKLPTNDEPNRTQLNTGDNSSRFNIKIKP